MEPLRCKIRQNVGSASCRRLRASGFIPANLYSGGNTETILLSIDNNEFVRFDNKNRGIRIFPIVFENNGETVNKHVLVKEVQSRDWKNQVVHLDFQEVHAGEMLEVTVPVHPYGECIGVKEGGVLNHISNTIVVSCTMETLPKRLDVDITNLKPGHALHVSDIPLPDGVTAVTPGNQAVLAVVETRATKEADAQETDEQEEGEAAAD